jgi:hypothetical protein
MRWMICPNSLSIFFILYLRFKLYHHSHWRQYDRLPRLGLAELVLVRRGLESFDTARLSRRKQFFQFALRYHSLLIAKLYHIHTFTASGHPHLLRVRFLPNWALRSFSNSPRQSSPFIFPAAAAIISTISFAPRW